MSEFQLIFTPNLPKAYVRLGGEHPSKVDVPFGTIVIPKFILSDGQLFPNQNRSFCYSILCIGMLSHGCEKIRDHKPLSLQEKSRALTREAKDSLLLLLGPNASAEVIRAKSFHMPTKKTMARKDRH